MLDVEASSVLPARTESYRLPNSAAENFPHYCEQSINTAVFLSKAATDMSARLHRRLGPVSFENLCFYAAESDTVHPQRRSGFRPFSTRAKYSVYIQLHWGSAKVVS